MRGMLPAGTVAFSNLYLKLLLYGSSGFSSVLNGQIKDPDNLRIHKHIYEFDSHIMLVS